MKFGSDFQKLIDQYLEGSISESGMNTLNERLRSDSEALREFTDLLNLDSALAAHAAGWERKNVQSQKIVSFPTTLRWIVAAACVALLATGGWWWTAPMPTFATVHVGAGVEEFKEGTRLSGGWQKIAAGSVEVVTALGAHVVIEAPAEFRFESAQRLHLAAGRVAADVPPEARGFTVITPTGEAVDLGTKFGVDVPKTGDAEIHVFQGEVIAQGIGKEKSRSLRDGQALSIKSDSGISRELRSAAFIRPDEIASLSAALAAGQQARSDSVLEKLRVDPSLIALLDFESESLPEGNYRMAQGRWPGTQAPEFVNVEDHMKIDVGGSHTWPAITLATWVRLDRLGDPYQSLLHTDGWSNQAGQVHWMVTRHTTMRLALYGNKLADSAREEEEYPDSLTSVLPEQGRWAHLATVYDSEKGTVRFYLNGNFDSETKQAIAHSAILGSAQIGNWNSQDRKLSGRIDEMLILGRTMSDEEIRSLFVAGNPYR